MNHQHLNELIQAKLKGKTLTVAPKTATAPVIDMMQALKKSLAAGYSGKRSQTISTEIHRQRPKSKLITGA